MITKEHRVVKLSEIIPYANNPRKNDQAVPVVEASIERFTYTTEIEVDESMVILAGHTRWKALKKMGVEECEVMIIRGMTNEEKIAYRLAHNKTGEVAEWDEELLMEELDAIEEIPMEELGFKTTATAPVEVVEDDYVPEEGEIEPVVKIGEIWKCGDHVLLCGDATCEEDVRRLVKEGGGTVNLVLTDPPYGIDIVNSGSALKGQVGASKLAKCNDYYPVIGDESIETAKDSYKIFKKLSDKLIIWGGNYFVDFLENSSSWIIWDKREGMASNNFADGEMAWCSFSTPVRIFHQLWSGMIRAGEHEKRVHPTQKPIRMLSEVLMRFSDPGDIILDVFGGSGSTLMACEQVHRRCLMMELDPHYCSVIIDRWEKFTGKKAVKVSG